MPHSKKEVLYQLAVGLEHIHSMKFIHCDIKPHNALIWVGYDGARGIEKVLMKWADFGISRRVGEAWTASLGTQSWKAPELLESQKNKNPKQSWSAKCDVFAEGLVFAYFLLNGKHPYDDSNKRNFSKIDSNISNEKYIVNLQGKIFNAFKRILLVLVINY